jgi:transmembrane sensor
MSVRLTAGKQAIISPEAPVELKPVNVGVATAWTRRELVFEFTPLAEAAAEFNRYNERQLIVEGEALRAFKISAVFRSTDYGSLVRYLQNLPGVQIRENEDTIVITSKDK